MSGTILVKDLIWQVCVLLQDAAPQYVHWTERELIAWLNDGHRAVAKYLPSAASRIDAVKLAAGTRQSIESVPAASIVPGDGIALAAPIRGLHLIEPIRNMGANGATPGRPIRVIERQMQDAQNSRWHEAAKAATPVREVMYDPKTPRYFYVNPGVPASTDWWIEIAWNVEPKAIPAGGAAGSELYLFSGANATAISIGNEYSDDLINYVTARAFMKESEQAQAMGGMGRAIAFGQQFTGSLNTKAQSLTGHNPNIRWLPFAPEPMAAAA